MNKDKIYKETQDFFVDMSIYYNHILKNFTDRKSIIKGLGLVRNYLHELAILYAKNPTMELYLNGSIDDLYDEFIKCLWKE